MTEQSKIPLPKPNKPGSSLIERAEGAFGSFSGLTPAPVPAILAEPTNRRVLKAAKPETPVEPPPVAQPLSANGASGVIAPTLPRAADTSDLSAGTPVVFRSAPQAVDRVRLQDQGLIVPEGGVTTLLEEFRIVKRQMLHAVRDGRASGAGAAAQRVLVCSPLPAEGKTFCATNLALAMASEKDAEVLLVDADFAKPSVLSLLGLRGGDGLMDALSNPAIQVEDCVIATDIPGFYVLPAGNRTASDSEYLASSRTAEVLDRLTDGAPNRIVIFDSPPALAASPAAELAKYAGQALVVCRADQTGQRSLEDALTLLSACPDIKLLLNAANFSPSGRKFGAYYGYGGSSR